MVRCNGCDCPLFRIFVKDIEGNYVLVNQAFVDFYGITVEEAIGLTDITERKLAQEELRLRDARFHVAIDLWANQIHRRNFGTKP
jgi:hypothetical protein